MRHKYFAEEKCISQILCSDPYPVGGKVIATLSQNRKDAKPMLPSRRLKPKGKKLRISLSSQALHAAMFSLMSHRG
jgi:hypothetical protein